MKSFIRRVRCGRCFDWMTLRSPPPLEPQDVPLESKLCVECRRAIERAAEEQRTRAFERYCERWRARNRPRGTSAGCPRAAIPVRDDSDDEGDANAEREYHGLRPDEDPYDLDKIREALGRALRPKNGN